MTEQQARELLRRIERQSDTNQGLGWRLSSGVGGAGLGYAIGSRSTTPGAGVLGALLGGVGGYGSSYLAQLLLKRLKAKDQLRRKTLYGILGSLYCRQFEVCLFKTLAAQRGGGASEPKAIAHTGCGISGAGAGLSAGLIRKDEQTPSEPMTPALVGAGLGGLAGFSYGAAADKLSDNFLYSNSSDDSEKQ